MMNHWNIAKMPFWIIQTAKNEDVKNYKQLHKFFIKVKKYEQLAKVEQGQEVWAAC